mmetsp:Transcript_4863/g.11363  ORF Transcript_4863/g.11363 Transcript_4863/m.11363 type:complete len:96 (-) Transcript_4863:608-895(-)
MQQPFPSVYSGGSACQHSSEDHAGNAFLRREARREDLTFLFYGPAHLRPSRAAGGWRAHRGGAATATKAVWATSGVIAALALWLCRAASWPKPAR